MRYEHHVLIEEAANDLTKHFGEKPSLARQVKKVVGRMAKGVGERGTGWWRASRRALRRKRMTQ